MANPPPPANHSQYVQRSYTAPVDRFFSNSSRVFVVVVLVVIILVDIVVVFFVVVILVVVIGVVIVTCLTVVR